MESELLVREALACYGLGDKEAFFSLLDPEIEWVVNSSFPLPFGGTYRGPEAVASVIASMEQRLQVTAVLWSNFASTATECVLYGMASHRCLSTGSHDTTAFAQWYELRERRILRVMQFFDTAAVQRMLDGKPGLRPAARNAGSSAEAVGLLAAAHRVETDTQEEAGPILGLYGPDAPPRSIALMERIDRHIEWNSSGLGSLPTGGPFHGVEAFSRHVDLARQLLGNYVLHIEGQISCGNTVALHGKIQLDSLPDDSASQPRWFHALTLREGRILRGLEIFDSQTLLQLLQGNAPSQ